MDDANVGSEDRLEVSDLGRMCSVSEGERADEKIFSLSFNALRKVECLFLEDEKIAFTLNSFFIAVSLFYVEDSVHDSLDGVFRTLRRQDVDVCFTFEVDALLCEEILGKVRGRNIFNDIVMNAPVFPFPVNRGEFRVTSLCRKSIAKIKKVT